MNSMYISAGALTGFQQKLDTVANNIANINTTGYKDREASFSENLAEQLNNQAVPDKETGRQTPNGIRLGYGVHLGLTSLNLAQGGATETKNPYDLMIDGKGFFQVAHTLEVTKDGENTETRYTRDGSFHPQLSEKGDTLYLENAAGDRLLDQNSEPIEFSTEYEAAIQPNGDIVLTDETNPKSQILHNQKVGLVDITNPSLLQNGGGNQFLLAAGAPAGIVKALNLNGPGASQIKAGFLENSNVDLTQEMNQMIISQRGYQLNARAVAYADQMMGIANEIMK